VRREVRNRWAGERGRVERGGDALELGARVADAADGRGRREHVVGRPQIEERGLGRLGREADLAVAERGGIRGRSQASFDLGGGHPLEAVERSSKVLHTNGTLRGGAGAALTLISFSDNY